MKKVLITGATDGIGLETAKLMAADGHHLLLHGRSASKIESAVAQLSSAYPHANIETYLADLSKFDDITALIANVRTQHTSLDVIINNAGVLKLPNPITQDGLDARFVVNTLAPVIITQGLLPILSDNARIVNLSSAAQAPVNVNAMLGTVTLGDDMQAYAQSKLALTIWVANLAQHLSQSQVAVAVNPGSLLASKMVKEGFGVAGNDLSIGAQVLVDASFSEKFETASGKYFDNDAKRFANPHPFALNEDNCNTVMHGVNDLVTKHA